MAESANQVMRYEFTAGIRFSSRLLWLPDEKQLYKKHSVYKSRYFYRCYEKNCNARVALSGDSCTRNSEPHKHPDNALLYKKIQGRGPTRRSRAAAEADHGEGFLDLPCCVPDCLNTFPASKAAFPRNVDLRMCWKNAIEAGTGKFLSDIKGGVCNLHFATQEKEGDYQEPSIFYRDNIRLQVGCCRLCLRYDIKDSLLAKHRLLVHNESLEWLTRKFYGIFKSAVEYKHNTLICEECLVKIDVTRTIVQQMENVSNTYYKLLKKKTTEIVQLSNTYFGEQDQALVNQDLQYESLTDSELAEPRAGSSDALAGSLDTYIVKEEPTIGESEGEITVEVAVEKKPEQVSAKLTISSKPLEQHSALNDENSAGDSYAFTVKKEPQDNESGEYDNFEFVIIKEEPTLAETVPVQMDDAPGILQTFESVEQYSKPAKQTCRRELKNDSQCSEPQNENMTEVILANNEQNMVSDGEEIFEVLVVQDEEENVQAPLVIEKTYALSHIPQNRLPGIASSKSSVIKCFICNTIVKSKEALSMHLRTHPGKDYHCDECNLTFNKIVAFNNHLSLHDGEMQFHDGEMQFQCSQCPLKFVGKRSKRLHEAYQHGIDHEADYGNLPSNNSCKFTCSSCGKSYDNITKLKTHEKLHNSHSYSKKNTCKTCGEMFLNADELTQHRVEQDHHPENSSSTQPQKSVKQFKKDQMAGAPTAKRSRTFCSVTFS